jgi:transcriptional regulator with XRE-family HTH domain
MELMEMSQRDLETKSGVSQRQISNILTQSTSCSIETADALAAAFGLVGWHLLIPDLPNELLRSTSIGKLVTAYVRASDDTRHYMDQVAEREGKYRNDP